MATAPAMAMPYRTYADALSLLNTLKSNREVVNSICDASYDKNKDAIPEMLEWTRKAGYNVADFARRGLRFIHIAGTKGKGSVCVMTEKVLLQYRGEDQELVNGRRRHIGKIGLYTSPHLVTVRERIRIDGIPISEAIFTRYFFELWDRLSDTSSNFASAHPNPQFSDTKPGYFRYLTLLAFHTFLEEGVETAIVECGIGGEYDSTNILPENAVYVTAITLLGIDHTGMLGETIQEIAWHKAGIMKRKTPVLSAKQIQDARTVIDQRAREKGLRVKYIPRHPDINSGEIRLGLEGDFQKDNASLAIAVASTYLQKKKVRTGSFEPGGKLPEAFLYGLENSKLQARCEVRTEGNIVWLIDGAHTEDSIKATAHWYLTKIQEARDSVNPPTMTMLIFNQEDRDADKLLGTLFSVLVGNERNQDTVDLVMPKAISMTMHIGGGNKSFSYGKYFTYAAFCKNTPFQANMQEAVDLRKQWAIGQSYAVRSGNQFHECYGSVEEAVALAKRMCKEEDKLMVLVTGSLHLAGGVIEVLDSQKKSKAVTE